MSNRSVASFCGPLVAVMFLTCLHCHAGQVENYMSFQARLTNDQGQPLTDGQHTLDFFIYASDTGGSPVGTILNVNVTLSGGNGVVSQPIGPVQDSWFNDAPRFLGITIDDNDDNPAGNELFPRIRLTAVPFAMRAFGLPTTAILAVQSASVSGPLTITGNVGIGSPSPSYNLEVLRPDGQASVVIGRSSDPGTGTTGYARLTGEDGFLDFETSQDKMNWTSAMRINNTANDNRVEILRPDGQAMLVIGRNGEQSHGFMRLTGEDGFLNFDTSQDLTGPWATVMHLSRYGQVGIGTSSPVSELDVRGRMDITATPGEPKCLEIESNFANVTNVPAAAFEGTDGGLAPWGLEINRKNGGGGLGNIQVLRVYNNGGNSVFWVNGEGRTTTTVLTITGGSDLAEPFTINDSVCKRAQPIPGMVVAIDPDHPGELIISSHPYDKTVAGVISGANGLDPGMVMRAEGQLHADGEHNVALTGRVWCWCDASFGSIAPGDRLTTSSTPGHAMRVTDRDRADGAVIGKAMTRLSESRGLVLVLVQPQ